MADLGTLAGIAGGFLFTALGLTVLALGPGRTANRAFAAFAVASSLPGAIVRLGSLGFPLDPSYALTIAIIFAGIGGILALAWAFPEPLTRADRDNVAAAVLTFAALAALSAPGLVRFTLTFPDSAAFHVANVLGLVQEWLAWALVVLYALRARMPTAPRRTYALVSLAMVILLAPRAGLAFAPIGGWTWDQWLAVAATAGVLAGVVGLWLWNTTLPAPARASYLVAWAALAFAMLGLASFSAEFGAWSLLIAATKTAAAAIIAYAILRGHLPGIEAKARWSLSRGTIAAFFVAVFFVASELAQQFFGARTGSAYVGIVASGLLVFAIAPLQRAADRIASAALPSGRRAQAEHEEVYRSAVRLAARERALTRDEERDLVRLAESLGIGATRAMDIRDEVNRERVAA